MSDGPGPRRGWRRPLLVTLLVVLAVYVLFTWVFPWITEIGLSPALE